MRIVVLVPRAVGGNRDGRVAPSRMQRLRGVWPAEYGKRSVDDASHDACDGGGECSSILCGCSLTEAADDIRAE